MKSFWKTNDFQIRWNEPLGKVECPYAHRYVFILFGYSIRLHVWKRSDDARYLHSHAWSFYTFVLKGSYTDVFISEENKKRQEDNPTIETKDLLEFDNLKRFSFRYRPSNHTHYVQIPKEGAVTLLFTSRPHNKWGFWVKNRILRPLRFFSRYGHPPCDTQ